MDWAMIEANHTPSRVCSGCGFMHFKDEFALLPWNRKDERHSCKDCVAAQTKAGTPLECMGACGVWTSYAAFSPADQRKTLHRVCIDCAERRHCKACGIEQQQTEFTSGEWAAACTSRKRGRCRSCMTYNAA